VGRPLFWSAGPLVHCPGDYWNVSGPADWKNSGPAPADYWNWASTSPLLNYLREVIFLAGSGIIW
jgi:hypothetical protein